MNSHIQLKLLALVCFGLAAGEIFANGLRLPSQDAFATARGEAFVATADNPSAVYYNPAGLTQLEGASLRSGIYALYYDPTYSPPSSAANAGKTYQIKKNFADAPQFFIAGSLTNLPVSFGLGVYAPYGGSISWPETTGFRTVGTKSSLTYIRLNPAIAVKLGEKFSLGAGVMLDYAKIDLEQGLHSFSQTPVNYFVFKGDGYSVGYNVGALWHPIEEISVGATFRSQTSFTMEGSTGVEQQPVIQATTLPAKTDFTFPLTAVVGLSYRPTPKWNLELDADYSDWSSFNTTTIRQQSTPPWPVQKNISVKLGWQASWIYEFGVTRYFDNGWHVSAGYAFDQNSVASKYYNPLVADMDRHFFSLGAGRKGKYFDFDLTYQFGYGPAHTVSGSTPSSTPGLFAGQSADGTYEFISHAVMLTVGLRF